VGLWSHSRRLAEKSMPKENRTSNYSDVLAKLHQARALVDECIAELNGVPLRKSARTPSRTRHPKGDLAHHDLDFDANQRAFVKAYARDLSGPKKFVLLVAYLAKGKIGTEVEVKEVEKHWNKMTAPNLLDGKFNSFYTSAAKEQGWVNTKKYGVYVLRPRWREALN